MNDRHDQATGEVDDTEVLSGDIIEPIDSRVMATLHRVEIDQQVATAKAYPRNVTKIKQELTALVTMDEETADDCIYALPRGNKHIKGPSARFADALISFWGNARSGAFITQVDKEDKFVEAIGSFQDVERNVIRQRRVRRPISDRNGRLYNADMINMTGNAACVIAERNAILNGIPKSLWGPAYDQAFALVAGTVKTLGEKLTRAEKHFMAMGISMDQVLEKLDRPDVSKIVPDDIVTMRGMLTALRTGEETVETIFGRGAGSNHEVVKNPLKDEVPAGSGDHQVESGGKSSPKPPETKDNAAGDPAKTAPANRTPASDPITSGPQASETAAGEGSGTAGGDAGAGGANEQTAAPVKPDAGKTVSAPAADEKPYNSAETYMEYMRDCFDIATSKSAITELWGATRTDRGELLSAPQIAELTKDKEAKLRALKLKEAK